MKKLLLLLLFVSLSFPLFSQYQTDIIVYLNNGHVSYYNLATGVNHDNMLEVGPTPNDMISYNHNVFIVNSGTWGANTSLQIIPEKAFYDFAIDGDTTAFRALAKKVMLTNNGNAWSVTGIDDSHVAVTLAQTGQIDVVNYVTGEVSNTYGGLSQGSPQGLCTVSGSVVAVAMSDWSDPNLGQGRSVAIMDLADGTLLDTVAAHLNVVDVKKLEDGNLVAYSWGGWFGDDNYGTLHYINGSTYDEIASLELPDAAKANYVIEVDAQTLYVNAFDADYNTVYGLYNLNTLQYTTVSDGLFANAVVGRLLDNESLLVMMDDHTEVHNQNMSNILNIPYVIGTVNAPLKYSAAVPVELTSFTANVSGANVVLNWVTATEINNRGFEVEKSSDNKSFEKAGFVEGNGTTTDVNNYSFTDSYNGGKVYYRIKQVDYDGSFEYSNTVEVSSVPTEFVLNQNYPNPFNPTTNISFNIPVNADVTLNVFNSIGENVAAIFNGNLEAGSHQFTFSASNLSSGIYFYTLNAISANSNYSKTGKMILLK